MKRAMISVGMISLCAGMAVLLLCLSETGVSSADPTGRDEQYCDGVPDKDAGGSTFPKCSHGAHQPSGQHASAPLLTLSDIPEGPFKRGMEGLTPETQHEILDQLRKEPQLRADLDSLRVDYGGELYYVCSFSPVPGTEMIEASRLVQGARDAFLESSAAGIPISSPPVLHSRPGCSKILFLDFNGHVIEGTRWNTGREVNSWNCLPYDKDGDTSTFSADELFMMTQIWERVSEDFSSFDIDVTTEEPDRWTSTTGHALITPGVDANGVDCPHATAGGVAYINKFGTALYSYNGAACFSPAWCKDYHEANAAEVISHELGHNFALYHDSWTDGSVTNTYYGGHDNGVIRWAPIMGVSYGEDVTQWCKGEYYNVLYATQDDLAEIAERAGYRPDLEGDTVSDATVLDVSPYGDIIQYGVIEQTDDPDVFVFSAGEGTVTLSASPYFADSRTWGGNLDILMELRDEEGVLLATNNPLTETSAEISRFLSSGIYYLIIKPVGVGDPMSSRPTGYTSYASIGQYWISGLLSMDADNDGMPNPWETEYFGGFTNGIATQDSDGDGADNYTEFIAGTVPTDPGSVFRILSYSKPLGEDPFILEWSTAPGRLYSVSKTPGLQYVDFEKGVLIENLPASVNSYTDRVEHAGQAMFYRVDVKIAP